MLDTFTKLNKLSRKIVYLFILGSGLLTMKINDCRLTSCEVLIDSVFYLVMIILIMLSRCLSISNL